MFSLSHNRFPLFYNNLDSDIARSGALSVLDDCRVSQPAAFDSFYMVYTLFQNGGQRIILLSAC